jgi:hypothetical protein
MDKITFCTLVTAALNLWLFVKLAFFSPFRQMPVIQSEGINSIILNTVWIFYSLTAYVVHRRLQSMNWIYGLIHYVILIIQYSMYNFDYVNYIREYIREGTYDINQYNVSAEELDRELDAYIPQEIQLINVQLFIYIAVTLISSWGLSTLGFLVSATVYYTTQTDKLASDSSGSVRIVILLFSVILFSIHLRASEVQMRAFLRVRDETSVLTKLVSILRCLPDGILISDPDQPLYFNQKVK